ncbi:MAG: exodeoxyribonuclease V subunit gamma [Rubrivivax sp. SCN 71-131]|nr:MAG: exodeoxyribonuclease V subunit gamma [Rubrivivax sp. SCN 71-131]
MLNLHFSNRTEALAERLLATLTEHEDDPFAFTELIVPSAAMRRWLTLAIARAQGIGANLRFHFLAQWLWRLLATQRPSAPQESPLATAVLGWRVYAAFGDAAWIAAHPRLAHYLAQADAVMRAELAQDVAALLEQYTSWRPDWLQAWGEGRRVLPAHPDEAWQAALWRRLAAELELPERQPVAAFVEALRRDGAAGARAAGLPARVHVFAPPAMPPLHQQLLAQLGGVMEVDVYILNPCREYWFELVDRRRLAHLAARGQAAAHEEGNPLLAAWGRQTQALVDGLVDLGGEALVDDGDYRPHPGSSLLAQLQNALLDLQPIEPGSITLAGEDRSLEVHVCHSRTRELEVLQERLLALFAHDPGLQPGDVLVVLPDLEAAAPLIEAVFGSTPAPRRIPFTITGRARSAVDAPARALLGLLDLLASRLPASAIVGLLQQPVVARRFAIDDDELEQVHAWLHAAGAHWGLDGAHRSGFGVPAQERGTLADGMARLFLGHALPPGLAEPFAGLLPGADIAGSDAALLGRLWSFVEALTHWHAALAQAQPPAAWATLLHAACDRFIAAAGDERADLRELHAVIAQLADEMQQGGLTEPLPLPVLRQALQQRLDDPARGGVPGGGVTFTAMSSLRGLPYGVVCVLGLDDGLFPGPARSVEFDLLAAMPRRGDRQRRLDERNLFLDLLLAARTHLHLSHTGRSVRDNAPLPPSVLVAELLDLLVPAIAGEAAGYEGLAAARARLVVEHPLQPFSPVAFQVDGDPRRRSHDEALAEALRQALAPRPAPGSTRGRPPDAASPAAAGAGADDGADEGTEDEDASPWPDLSQQAPFLAAPLPAPGPEWRRVAIEQLVQFFRHPSRALLRRRLGIELAWDGEELEDDEPLHADARTQRRLAERLLPALLAGADRERALRLAQAGADWPAGALGQVQLEQALPPLERFAQRVREATTTPPIDPRVVEQAFDLDGESWTLVITLAGLRLEGQTRWRAGSLRAQDRLEAWIQHLALCAAAPADVARRTRWIALDEALALTPVPEASAELARLLRHYRRGLTEPLHFYPRTSWTFVHTQGNRDQARAAWTPGPYNAHAEGADAAHRLALRGCAEPLDAAFEEIAHAVFGPLLAHTDAEADAEADAETDAAGGNGEPA